VSGDKSTGDASPKDSKFMQDFFSDVEIIKQNIAAIRNASVQLADIDQQVLFWICKFNINQNLTSQNFRLSSQQHLNVKRSSVTN
jgi:hypothetical protein